MSEYETVVCRKCGRGDWQDYEPGDSLKKCPFCEKQNVVLTTLTEYNDGA